MSLKDLLNEKRLADKLFYMALTRRNRAIQALELYYKAHPNEVPVRQLDLFDDLAEQEYALSAYEKGLGVT
jgi:hypothetical protein